MGRNVSFFKDKDSFTSFFNSTKNDSFSSNEIYLELIKETSKWCWYGTDFKSIKLFIPTESCEYFTRILIFLIRQMIESLNLQIQWCFVNRLDTTNVYNIDGQSRERIEIFEIEIMMNTSEGTRDRIEEVLITPNNPYFWEHEENNKDNVQSYQYGLEGDFSFLIRKMFSTFGPKPTLRFFLQGLIAYEHGDDTVAVYNNLKEYEMSRFSFLSENDKLAKFKKLMDWAEDLGMVEQVEIPITLTLKN